MMNATKKLSAGVYQVVGTDWAIKNDSHKSWWVCKIVDGIDSIEPHEMLFIGGTRNDAIQYAHELQVQS
jgi:hypothetical protein